MYKRNQKQWKAQWPQALRAAREAKKVKQASKKTAMAALKASAKAASEQKMAKPVKISGSQVGGKL